MWSSKKRFLWLLAAGALFSSEAGAAPVQGFAVDRLYTSAPGAGWVAMDALDSHGGFGGAMALTTAYSRNPLRVGDLALINTYATEDLGIAGTYGASRLYFNFTSPLSIQGDSGSVGAYDYTAPSIDWGNQPDTLSDMRIGFDTRVLGDWNSPFRLGIGAQLWAPSGTTPGGNRADYDTDEKFRPMLRLLFAGDSGAFTYAGHAGVHYRKLNDAPAPGSAQGSEFLLGLAGGVKLHAGKEKAWVVGAEFTEATALRAFQARAATAQELLGTFRWEGTGEAGTQFRVKLAGGAGLHPGQFGTPQWRAFLAFEVFGHGAGDGGGR
jgi:hypothetical protein